MKTNPLRLLAYMCTALFMITALAACRTTPPDKPQPNVPNEPSVQTHNALTVGYDSFSGQFHPFFARTPNDRAVTSLVTLPLLNTDRNGNVILNGATGETIPYNGTDYQYQGIADVAVTEQDDGTVTYDFTLREGVTFSDSEPLTADDVIFSMYVLADPSYDGPFLFSTLPIQGLGEYRTGVSAAVYEKYAALADAIWAAGPNATAYNGFTEAQYTAYWGDVLTAAGAMFVEEIVDYCLQNYADRLSRCGNHAVVLGMYAWGYGTLNEDGTFTDTVGTTYDLKTTFPTEADFWQQILASHNGDFSKDGIDRDAAATSIADLLKQAFIAAEGPKDEEGNGAVSFITGIEKTGEHTVRVTLTAFDAAAADLLCIPVAPLHYYGADDAYDSESHRFGFTKGDLSEIKAKTAPLGGGPYVFDQYENGVITFTANTTYYKGCPPITTLLFKALGDTDPLAAVTEGTVDITAADIPALDSEELTAVTAEHGGYGYFGIHANHVKVGEDAGSAASKYLRKALATVFAVYRDTAVFSYYGTRAHVMQYPAATAWTTPQSNDGDTVAYTTDSNGEPLYTADMTAEERQSAALDAAVAFLKAAGYVWDDAAGTFVAAPVGAKLTYEVLLAADGNTEHPHVAILTAARDALATIGITLQIQNVGDTAHLYTALEAGTAAIWAAEQTPAPDVYAKYHSTNAVDKGGAGTNDYAIADTTLDQHLADIRALTDPALRQAAYRACLDTVLDWGVEIPVYQRQATVLFRTARINAQTIPADITAHWDWMQAIETLAIQE